MKCSVEIMAVDVTNLSGSSFYSSLSLVAVTMATTEVSATDVANKL
ncbi:MAG: hypothetical protein IJ217_03185 [Clostridia bacterium]|nr:hypothetical protein [Clostridia bacterium]